MYMYAEFIRMWRSKCGFRQRDGQVLYNLIYELDCKRETKIAEKLRGSRFDPFDNDAKIKGCLEELWKIGFFDTCE